MAPVWFVLLAWMTCPVVLPLVMPSLLLLLLVLAGARPCPLLEAAAPCILLS
jgi:hypothetical protein